MAEEPPWPPPDPTRPFDWERDDVEWGAPGISEGLQSCIILIFAAAFLAAGLIMLYVWFL